MKKLRIFFELLKQTFQDWNADHAPRLAAALSYYTAFAIAPLLVIAIAIAGAVLGQDQVQRQVMNAIGDTVSSDAASLISGMIESASQPREGTIATIIGLITLLFGAIGAFSQLQGALDAIWDVEDKPRKGGIFGIVRSYLLNFGMVIFVGFLLLVSLILTTVLSAAGQFLGNFIQTGLVLQIVNLVVGFIVITLLFALIYKVLPRAEVAWRDVWIGAAFTAVLFSIGRFALSFYLAQSSTASAYGAAGSFVVILLWVYYSAQILLFGAEFTQVFSSRFGTRYKQGYVLKGTKGAAAGAIPRERAIVPVASPVSPPAAQPPRRAAFPAAVIMSVGVVALSAIAAILTSDNRQKA
jgi:membrane protein